MTMNQAIDEDIHSVEGYLVHLISILRQGTEVEHKLTKKHKKDLARIGNAVEAVLTRKAKPTK